MIPPTVEIIQHAIWLNVHIGTAILSACLPTLRPVLTKTVMIFSNIRQKYGFGGNTPDALRSKQSAAVLGYNYKEPFHPLEQSKDMIHLTEISASQADVDDYNVNGVEVRRPAEVV